MNLRGAGERHPLALVWLGVVMFSCGSILFSVADGSGPVLSFWRLWWGIGVLGSATLVQGRARRAPWSREGVVWTVRCGLAFAAHQVMVVTALKATSVVDVSLMQVLAPIVVAVAAVPMFGERPGAGFRLWSVLAAAGAVVVILSGSSGPSGDPVGMALAAGNVVFFALYVVWSKRAREHMDVLPFLLGVLLAAAPTVSLYLVVTGESPFAVGRDTLLVTAVIAAVPGALGQFVTMWPLRWLPANVVPLVQLAIPFVAGSLAWVLLGEAVTVTHLVGGAVTVVGTAGAIRCRGGRRLLHDDAAVAAVTGAT